MAIFATSLHLSPLYQQRRLNTTLSRKKFNEIKALVTLGQAD
jgi:hypothetical protein